jgi:hypothetical protein
MQQASWAKRCVTLLRVLLTLYTDGFGGLVVSMLAEAVGFLTSVKNPQYAFLRRGRKKNLSHVPALRHVKEPNNRRELLDC